MFLFTQWIGDNPTDSFPILELCRMIYNSTVEALKTVKGMVGKVKNIEISLW